MKKLLLMLSILLFGLSTTARGEKITLKNSFFGGWKYSVDAVTFHKVGTTGSSLRLIMEDSEPAQDEMGIYKTHKILATVTGIPGGFILGWCAGAAIWGDWNDTYNTLLIIGIPLTATSIVFEVLAVSHLKKAVRIYNGEEHALYFNIGYNVPAPTYDNAVYGALTWSF